MTTYRWHAAAWHNMAAQPSLSPARITGLPLTLAAADGQAGTFTGVVYLGCTAAAAEAAEATWSCWSCWRIPASGCTGQRGRGREECRGERRG